MDKHDPAPAPHIPYAIANQRIEHVASPTHVPFGFWRSVDHSQHGFFTESFMDELAHAAGEDPYQFRRRLLAHAPRHRQVLDAAAEAADWGSEAGERRGRGIALQESFGTIVAQVVDVAIANGQPSVERVVCAVDAGFAVNPVGLTAQMESGIVYALSAALYGEISIERGRVKQSNYHDYPVLRMDEMPVIDTVIVNGGGPLRRWRRTRHAAAGAGLGQRHLRRHRLAHPRAAGGEARFGRAAAGIGLAATPATYRLRRITPTLKPSMANCSRRRSTSIGS